MDDYAYWLQISKVASIGRIPEKHYFYRLHKNSLTGQRELEIRKKLNELREDEIEYLSCKISERYRKQLAIDMLLYSGNIETIEVIYKNREIPVEVNEVMKQRSFDKNKKTIIFGAGNYGLRTLDFLGEENIHCFIDNNQERVGEKIRGIEIKPFSYLRSNYEEYNIVVAVGIAYISQLIEQLIENGIKLFISYTELCGNGQEDILTIDQERRNKLREVIQNNVKDIDNLGGGFWENVNVDSEIKFWLEIILKEKGSDNSKKCNDVELLSLLVFLKRCIVQGKLFNEFYELQSKINQEISNRDAL